MDKCLPVIDLFSNGQRDSGSVSEDVSSPIIWEDMSVFYLRQLASSLQVRAGVMKVPQNPPATPNAATPNDRAQCLPMQCFNNNNHCHCIHLCSWFDVQTMLFYTYTFLLLG